MAGEESNAEIQQWFTSHGKVTAANTVPDPANRNSTLIEYSFEDGAKLTVRPSTPMTDDKGQPTGTSTPQEIVGRELPKPASTTKARNVYIGTNPSTGRPTQVSEYPDGHKEYDDTQVPASAVVAPPTSRQPEGTPTGQVDANGQPVYDNSKPIMVTRNSQTHAIIKSEPLTAPELAQWEKDTGRAQTATAREEVKDHPGVYHVVSKDANGNTDDHYENTAGARVPMPGAAPTSAQEPVEGYPGWSVRKSTENGQTKTVYINPAGQEAPDPHPSANTAKDTPATEVRNGQTYIKHTVTKPDGTPGEIYYTDQNGTRVTLPNESKPGATTVIDGVTYWATPNADPSKPPTLTPLQPGGNNAGPPLPQLIFGHTEEAIRSYEAQLNAEVAAGKMTPAERSKRMSEAMTMATHVLNEANLQQNEIQSQRSSASNLAQSRLSAATTGMGQALSFVQNINKDLPIGSDLGGKAFAAILGLQLMNAQRMGAYPPGLDQKFEPSAAPSRTSATPSSTPPPPSAPSATADAATAPPPPLLPPPPPVGADPMAPPATATTPTTQDGSIFTSPAAAPPSPPPALPSTPAPPPPPASPPLNGQPDLSSLRIVPDASGGLPTYVAPDGGMYTLQRGQMIKIGQNPNAYQTATPQTPVKSGDDPNAVGMAPPRPDYAVMAQVPMPTSPGNPPPDSGGYRSPDLTYPNDYGRPPPGSVVNPEGVDVTNTRFMPPLGPFPADRTPSGVGPDTMYRQPLGVAQPQPDYAVLPYAQMHQRAASVPPWQMNPADLQAYLDAGVPESVVFGIPGRGMVA